MYWIPLKTTTLGYLTPLLFFTSLSQAQIQAYFDHLVSSRDIQGHIERKFPLSSQDHLKHYFQHQLDTELTLRESLLSYFQFLFPAELSIFNLYHILFPLISKLHWENPPSVTLFILSAFSFITSRHIHVSILPNKGFSMLFSSDNPFFPYKLAFLRVSSFLSPIYNPSLLWSGFRLHTFNRNKTSNNFLISKASGHFPSLYSIGPFLKFSLLLASVRPLVIPYDKLLQFGVVVKRR